MMKLPMMKLPKIFFNMMLMAIFCTVTVYSTVYARSATVSDSIITTKLKATIANDPTISVFDIDISTNRGIVVYDGKVESNSQAEKLIQLAIATKGVKDVDTARLTVQDSDQPLTDSFITAKIKGLFAQKKLFGSNDIAPMAIHVETNNGVVYLTGQASKRQINNAIKLAKSIKGVKRVESQIQANH